MDDKNNFSQGSSMLISGVLVGDLVILNSFSKPQAVNSVI